MVSKLVKAVEGEAEAEADESDRMNGRVARILQTRFDEAKIMNRETTINSVEIQ